MRKHLKVILVAVALLTGLVIGRLWPRSAPAGWVPVYVPGAPVQVTWHVQAEYQTGDVDTLIHWYADTFAGEVTRSDGDASGPCAAGQCFYIAGQDLSASGILSGTTVLVNAVGEHQQR